jgi:hypothetical protein
MSDLLVSDVRDGVAFLRMNCVDKHNASLTP